MITLVERKKNVLVRGIAPENKNKMTQRQLLPKMACMNSKGNWQINVNSLTLFERFCYRFFDEVQIPLSVADKRIQRSVDATNSESDVKRRALKPGFEKDKSTTKIHRSDLSVHALSLAM